MGLEQLELSLRSIGDQVASHSPRKAPELLEVMRSEEFRRLGEAIAAEPRALRDLVLRSLSREVSTHYKWCLFASQGWSLWVNEYKASTTSGYARSVHDHRYDFASQILTGGISQRTFVIDHDESDVSACRVGKPHFLGASSTYALRSEEIHRLESWLPGTATLLLKGPAFKDTSRVFDLTNFSVTQTASMSALHPLDGGFGHELVPPPITHS